MSETATFREAMSRFPSGVVIATTVAADGTPQGFTASSFCSVSLDPPLVLVCLSTRALCYPAFEAARHFAINILRPEHEAAARRLATRGAEKFAGDDFAFAENGLPLLRGALVTILCDKESMQPAGDHAILLGRATRVELGPEGPALAHHQRQFWPIGGEAI